MGTRRRVTLRRIAEDVGVSPMTVSNAFNRPGQLSAGLRERILDRARELGYAGPDPLARGLRRGRSGAIGVVSDTPLSYAFADPAASAALAGLCATAEHEGLGVLLVAAGGSGPLSDAVVDGVVVLSVSAGDPLVELTLARGLPAVVVDQPRDAGLPVVGIDDEGAAADAARHLVERGHTRIAVVAFGLSPDGRTGPADLERRRTSAYDVSRSRLRGYERVLTAAGIDWAGVQVLECGESDRAAGRAAAATLLESDHAPTAILATSDVLALGVLDAAGDAVAVVGFDDVPEAAAAGLTTVRQDHHAKGRIAGELLLAALRGEAIASPEPLRHALVVRTSA